MYTYVLLKAYFIASFLCFQGFVKTGLSPLSLFSFFPHLVCTAQTIKLCAGD